MIPRNKIFTGINRKKLERLLSVIPAIISESNIEQLLQLILANTTEVMEAERASIFVLDQAKNELWTFVTEGGDTKEIRIAADKGIVGAVVQSGEVLRIKDAYTDDRFETSVDQKTGFRTRAIMAMPIIGRSKNIIGVIEVLNKTSGLKYFTDKDKKMLEAFTSLVAISLENSMQMIDLKTSLDSLSRYSNSLERYSSKHILDMLKAGDDPAAASAFYEKKAVVFSDIRNFTEKSKHMGSEETVNYLNGYFRMLHEACIARGGNLEKIMGDSVMASFVKADDAFIASSQFIDQVRQMNDLDCGIGLTFGEVLVGNIGSEYKLDYTIIGECVNLASRLEKLTKKVDYKMLLSEDFVSQLSHENRGRLNHIGRVRIRGLENPVRLYGY